MKQYDVRELLDKCVKDGFPIESISKATNVDTDLIARFYDNFPLSQSQTDDLIPLNYFLMQLYPAIPRDHYYLRSITEAINTFYGIPYNTIAKYLNLESEVELNNFLDAPQSFKDNLVLTLQIMHLFTLLVRDKQQSLN